VMVFPNPFRAIWAAAVALWAKWRGYEVIADEITEAGRRMVCENCEFRRGEQCGVCSCFIIAKTMLYTEQCPRKKWLRRWIKKRTV
jgi:hypothetical protein